MNRNECTPHALYAFAAHPTIDAKLATVLGPRMNLDTLKQQVKHMGLSGSMLYLLPVLFSKADLSETVLDACRDAIAVRNDVVHNGQRHVRPETLTRSLTSIRSMCDFLESFTASTEDAAGGV